MSESRKGYIWVVAICVLLLGMSESCGGSDTSSPRPTADASATPGIDSAPTIDTKSPPTDETEISPTPTATPAVTPLQPPVVSKDGPQGTLNVGMTDMAPPAFFLPNERGEQSKFNGLVTHETMFRTSADGEVIPMLVQSFDIDAGGLVYTFYLQEGARWHNHLGEYGEFDADDFIWSAEQVSTEGSIHAAAVDVRRIFLCAGCSLEKMDSHTVRLTRPSPTVEITWWSRQPEGSAWEIHSKEHFELVGEEAANIQAVGTGPWMMDEEDTGNFLRLRAVRDHWRRTPDWEEMIWWKIGRLANFRGGQLDTVLLSRESIEAITSEAPEGVEYMSFPGSNQVFINILGQQYFPEHPAHQPSADGTQARVPIGEGAGYTVRCTELPYVSCDRSVGSAEWERARKVRLAMATSIDRRKLVDELTSGDGSALFVREWTGHEGKARQYGLKVLVWEFDPARARELLAEGGYPDGFNINFALPLRPGAQGAIVAGVAIANMWSEVGITTKLANMPLSAYRPGLVSRTNIGVNAHNGVPPLEPLMTYRDLYNVESSLNFGFEHPDYQEMLERGSSTTNADQRFVIEAEMARFMFANVMTIPVYQENSVWPLGPGIDEWSVQPRVYDWLSNWEDVPHRR